MQQHRFFSSIFRCRSAPAGKKVRLVWLLVFRPFCSVATIFVVGNEASERPRYPRRGYPPEGSASTPKSSSRATLIAIDRKWRTEPNRSPAYHDGTSLPTE